MLIFSQIMRRNTSFHSFIHLIHFISDVEVALQQVLIFKGSSVYITISYLIKKPNYNSSKSLVNIENVIYGLKMHIHTV